MRTDRLLALTLAAVSVGCVSSRAGVDEAWGVAGERAKLATPDDEGGVEKVRGRLLGAPITPDAAAELALSGNPRAEMALARLGLSRADLARALRMPNPRAHFSANFEGDEHVDLELEVTLDVLAFALMPGREHAASLGLEAASLVAGAELLRIAHEARAALIEYQAQRQRFDLEKTSLFVAAQALELATRLHEAGNTPRLPLLEERARFEDGRLALARSELALMAARERASAAMGLFGGDATAWEASPELAAPEPFDVSALEGRAVEASLEVEAAAKRYAAADAQADVAWGQAFVPGLDAGVGVERSSDAWGVGPRIGLELPLLHQAQGELEAAHASRAIASSEHRAAALSARMAARDAAARVTAAGDTLAFYDGTLLPLRAEIVEEVLAHYNAMDASAFALLLAKREELATKRERVAALRDWWLAKNDATALLAGVTPMTSPTRGPDAPTTAPSASRAHD